MQSKPSFVPPVHCFCAADMHRQGPLIFVAPVASHFGVLSHVLAISPIVDAKQYCPAAHTGGVASTQVPPPGEQNKGSTKQESPSFVPPEHTFGPTDDIHLHPPVGATWVPDVAHFGVLSHVFAVTVAGAAA